MKPSIENLANPSPPSLFFSDSFKTLIEDHLTWLINHERTRIIPVNAHQVDVYDFDWIGLFLTLKIPAELHAITIRMNGGVSYTDVPSNLSQLYVPDIGVIQNLIQINESSTRIT